MKLIDSHCHIHSDDYGLDADEVIAAAHKLKIDKFVCIGVGVTDSKKAVEFAEVHNDCWASIGLHPHDAKQGSVSLESIKSLLDIPDTNSGDAVAESRIVAIGECGLDYHYNYSTKKEQAEALHFQIQLAIEKGLPLIFHIRDAFEDFWPIFDQYPKARGVVHSFTAGPKELDEVLSRNLLVGINGIITFTRDTLQLEAVRRIPLQSLILETDAPLLTPEPFRGRINEPKHIFEIAKFLSKLRGESLAKIAKATARNAENLYNI